MWRGLAASGWLLRAATAQQAEQTWSHVKFETCRPGDDHQRHRDLSLLKSSQLLSELPLPRRIRRWGPIHITGQQHGIELLVYGVIEETCQALQEVHQPRVQPRGWVETAVVFGAEMKIGQMQ